MGRFLTISATAILFSGCCTVPPHVPFECPERFQFVDYPDALWLSLPEEVQNKINEDDLNAKDYIKACEEAAEIHNED